MDFSADPEAVSAVAEAHRLASGHLFNPAFATETSLIDPLPHQRIAVYQRMLQQSPLRFLLADDAGAGKNIMTGLYVREMLSRRLLRRVLVVPPAGLVGNWEREMRTLFRLPFRIVGGAEARAGNPFLGPESDLVIVSVDTLAGERMFGHLKDQQTDPYDLVVFDEAHKLSADRQPDFRVRKTGRYRLAEALAGAESDDKDRWELPWSAQHLLLLTATPHMGKDHPYYYLWRLLLPDALSTFDAFEEFPPDSRLRQLHPPHQGGDGPLRPPAPLPAAQLRHPELRPVPGTGRRAGAVRRDHGVHALSLQLGQGAQPFRRPPWP